MKNSLRSNYFSLHLHACKFHHSVENSSSISKNNIPVSTTGSTIKSGDRFLRYTYFQIKKRRTLPCTPCSPFHTSPSLRNSQPVTPGSAAPPPKPKRSWVYIGSLEHINLIGSDDVTDETNEEIDTVKLQVMQVIGS